MFDMVRKSQTIELTHKESERGKMFEQFKEIQFLQQSLYTGNRIEDKVDKNGKVSVNDSSVAQALFALTWRMELGKYT